MSHCGLPPQAFDPWALRTQSASMFTGPRLLAALLALAVSATPSGARAQEHPAAPLIRAAVDGLCPATTLTGLAAQTAIEGSWLLEESVWPNPDDPRRVVLRLATADGGEITLDRRTANGRLRQFRASYAALEDGALRPALQATADGGCVIRAARAIRAGDPPWRYLDQLDGDLATLRWTETLQAPWPTGKDPGGVRVGFVDSGLAYDLPLFRDRLARDGDGTPLGYDYWDMDPWPYDGDMARGAFFPIRHGTTVASVFVAEAPEAALVPYRYPRPDMSRLGALVAKASARGVRILAMPLGSTRPADWEAFAEALARHDMLAIVSAGNDGRDIDAAPVYPAALPVETLITVTSSDGVGRLARGSNWGAEHVDLMLPAENLPVVDFRGARGTASGSSYAVPRLAALAARLLARDPDMPIAELKAQIFARAVPSPFELEGTLAVGWIADPLAD